MTGALAPFSYLVKNKIFTFVKSFIAPIPHQHKNEEMQKNLFRLIISPRASNIKLFIGVINYVEQ